MGETRVDIGVGAIEAPADGGEAVDQNTAAAAAAPVDICLRVEGVVIELEGTEDVFGADVEAPHAVREIAGAGGGLLDGGAGGGADLGDAIGVAGQNAGGGVGAGDRQRGIEDGLRGEGARLVLATEGFHGVARDGVDGELGGGRETVVGFEADAGLLAVVVIIPGAVVPEVGGLRGGVFEIAQGAEAADGVFGVEYVE